MKLYITEASILVLLVVYLPIVLLILWRIAKSKRWRGAGKAAVIVAFLAVAYAIPLGDVTLNSMAMMKVCPKAGLHIYKQVKVDGYFDRSGGEYVLQGLPYRFIEYTRPGEKITRLERQEGIHIKKTVLDAISAQYEIVYEEAAYNRALGVKRKRYWVRDTKNQDVLGEWLEFGAVAGWLDRMLVIRWFGGSVGACGNDPEAYLFRSKILQPK